MSQRIYIVVGEPSGDILASRLMTALKQKLPDVQFFGTGGETMVAAGFRSLFDIAEISVMGIWEVVPRLPLIMKRLRQTVADIANIRPDILITVDSWGFVHQLLNRLKKQNTDIPKIHYVAPQVWAWKRGRARTAARLFDGLLTLLPSEPPYFEKYGLQCTFAGHPVIENTANLNFDDAAFRARHNIPQECTLLCALPGSRSGEVKRLSPIFKDVIKEIKKHFPDVFVVIPAVKAMQEQVQAAFARCAAPYCVVAGRTERYAAFHACGAALAASGTVSLELTACGTPHVVAYRFSRFSNIMAEWLVRPHTPFANLINILANREIIPECMLGDCRADYILPRLLDLMQNHDKRTAQVSNAQLSLQKLCPQDMLPSQKAAEVIIEALNR